MDWIKEKKYLLNDWINDCFEDLDSCYVCPHKEACDKIWEIVRKMEEN